MLRYSFCYERCNRAKNLEASNDIRVSNKSLAQNFIYISNVNKEYIDLKGEIIQFKKRKSLQIHLLSHLPIYIEIRK